MGARARVRPHRARWPSRTGGPLLADDDDRDGPGPRPCPRCLPPPADLQGIQPSGAPHLGNDLGAIRNYVRLQAEYDTIYCIVDYHALTSLHDPDALRARTREMGAALVALGLDPDRCILFVQSHRPEHTELAWLLMTVTPVSWLERTPTYKEKRENQPDDINHGLLTYPVPPRTSSSTRRRWSRSARTRPPTWSSLVALNSIYGETVPEPQAVRH